VSIFAHLTLNSQYKDKQGKREYNLWEYYYMHMRKFAEVLTDMERRGIRVDAKDYLAGIEVQARKDRIDHVNSFRSWLYKQIGIDGLAINPASSNQVGAFLFGGSMNIKTKEKSG
jgi:DNA polymerase-1